MIDQAKDLESERSTLLSSRGRTAGLLFALAIVSLWLLGSGYVGLSHDARLYALQVLYRLQPEIYASDLFLANGSQDDFTLYTRLAAPLTNSIGLFPVVRLVGVGGALLWVLGLLLLAKRMASDGRNWRLGAILVLALPPSYGCLDVFEIGRNLATPRVFSEALVLMALVVWSRRYPTEASNRGGNNLASSLGAVLLLGFAGLLHPLMALPGVMVVVIEWVLATRRWKLLAAVAVVVGAGAATLAVLRVGPLAGLWVRFDDLWFAIVDHRSPHLFLSHWEPKNWSQLVFYLSMGVAGAVLLEGWRRRLLVAAIIVAASGVLLNGVGGDLLHNVLLTQLQLFRFSWLLLVLVPLSVHAVLRDLSDQSRLDRVSLAVVASLAAIAVVGVSPFQFAFAMVAAPVAAVWLVRRSRGERASVEPFVVRSMVVVAVAVVSMDFYGGIQDAQVYQSAAMGGFGNGLRFVSFPLCLGLGGLFLWLLSLPRRPLAMSVLLPVALASLAVGLVGFDWRFAVTAAIERRVGQEELNDVLPPEGEVFWQGEPLVPWVLLGRSSYFSRVQGAGLVFERKTALEYERRAQLLGPLGATLGDSTVGPDVVTEEPILQRLCMDQAKIGLVAVAGPVPQQLVVGSWPPVFDLPDTGDRRVPGGFEYSLVLCSDVLGR